MDAELLAKRLEREKAARKQAEALLEEKSREVFLANTELQKAAHELAGQTKQLNTIIDRTLAGILLVDDRNAIRRANRSAQCMFAREPENIVGRSIFELFHSDQWSTIRLAEQHPNPSEKLDQSDVVYESKGARPGGETFPIELAIAAVDIDDRRHTVWICRDLTRRKQAEAKRAALEQELRQAQKLESLGTLASGIAHEINTPIQYVSDNAHFLKDSFADLLAVLDRHETFIQSAAEAGQMADQVAEVRAAEEEADLAFLREEIPNSAGQTLEGIQRVSKIVTAIKEFSHPGTTEKTLIDLNKAIETTLTVTRNQWKYVAELETDFDPALPDVPCLPGDINQAILNLIVNAAQAIEDRGDEPPGRITITTRRKGNVAEVAIADNGGGIAEEHRGQIFDPFFTTKDVGKGTGQGLSIVHGIITQKHEGSISFTTQVSEGTTFVIELPLADSVEMKEAV